MSVSKGKGNQDQPKTTIGAAFENAGYNKPQGNQGTQGNQGPASHEAKHDGPPRRRSIVEMNSAMPRPVSRQPTGEVVMKFQDTLQEQMGRNFRQGFDQFFRLVVLDNNTENVPLSAIMMCYHEQSGGEDFLAVYTLLVEGSSGRLNTRTINMGGQQVEIETVAGDVLVTNDYMWGKIQETVLAAYGRRMEVMDAGSMVLPTELDPENEEALRRVLFNSTQACFTVMANRINDKEEPFSVDWVNSSSDTLVARLDYNPGQAETATGEPVRSDVRITLQGTLAGQQNQAGFEQVRELSSVDGYIDLVYVPPQQQAFNHPPVTQHYYPRFVITRADTEIDAVTMELQLLALSTTTLLSRNHAWAGVFRPRPVKGVDLRDIGAVGYEVNFTGDQNAKPEYIDTKAQDFDLNALYQFVSMSINDGLLYSMDIEEVGELSWIHQAFLASANGDHEVTRLILDSANNLTNGAFGEIWQGGAICVDDNNRIHLGHYTDENGQVRDLRDIDYLALLNLAGKNDPSVVVEWGNSFDQIDVPMEIRLEKRAKILKAMLGSSLVIKGYARRITFEPAFLEVLNIACAKAGLTIRPNNLIQEFSGAGTRGNFNAANFALGGQGANTLFNYGTPQWGQQTHGFGSYTGRFGR